MKRCVCITFDVDPTEYYKAKDSVVGVVKLVTAMLKGEVDFPEAMTVACEGVSERIENS